ncbi:MAG: DNA polymerase III subunit delta [Clostridium sp.]
MINIDGFESELKKGDIGLGYVFCGLDEELIKENINILVKKLVPDEFMTLNYERLDGLTTTFNDIENACETMPFFGEKKAIVVYRANFLKDKTDKEGAKLYSEISEYVKNLPPYAVLIMYYLFNDKRDTPKKNKKLGTLDKYIKVVHCDKLKKDKYYKKIEDIFKENGKNIGKIQVRYFGEKVQNNFDIIKSEIDKLCAYTYGREIEKEDIDKLIANKSEDDIFDLVEYISNKKVDRALDLLDDLLFKADQHILIITTIENHFKRLYEIKIYMSKGKRVDYFMSKYRLPQFVCEKLMNQANKFSLKQLGQFIRICVDTENKLKSSTGDKSTEMELMLFKTFLAK